MRMLLGNRMWPRAESWDALTGERLNSDEVSQGATFEVGRIKKNVSRGRKRSNVSDNREIKSKI